MLFLLKVVNSILGKDSILGSEIFEYPLYRYFLVKANKTAVDPKLKASKIITYTVKFWDEASVGWKVGASVGDSSTFKV